jgi:predicted neutral ceramidase superfamily lipid hydrolase
MDLSWHGAWVVLSGNRLIDGIFSYLVSFPVLIPASILSMWLLRHKAIAKTQLFLWVHIAGYFLAYFISLYSIWINPLIPSFDYKFQYISLLVGFAFLLLVNTVFINLLDFRKYKKLLLTAIAVMLFTLLIMPDSLKEAGVSRAYFDD